MKNICKHCKLESNIADDPLFLSHLQCVECSNSRKKNYYVPRKNAVGRPKKESGIEPIPDDWKALFHKLLLEKYPKVIAEEYYSKHILNIDELDKLGEIDEMDGLDGINSLDKLDIVVVKTDKLVNPHPNPNYRILDLSQK